jgi:hypothetical protein
MWEPLLDADFSGHPYVLCKQAKLNSRHRKVDAVGSSAVSLHFAGDYAKGKLFNPSCSLFAGVTVCKRTRNLLDLSDPTTVVFAIKNDSEVHSITQYF